MFKTTALRATFLTRQRRANSVVIYIRSSDVNVSRIVQSATPCDQSSCLVHLNSAMIHDLLKLPLLARSNHARRTLDPCRASNAYLLWAPELLD